jgi:hypothetical protein
MNLAEAIQTRWAATPSLCALLPAGQVMTGIYFAQTPPLRFATIALRGGTVEGYANDGSSIDTAAVRIQVHHDQYDQGAAIVAAVLAAFDRSDFAMGATDRVLCVQKSGVPSEAQDPQTGQWDWLIDFNCRLWKG